MKRVVKDADPVWIVIALGLNVLSFVAYIALFRGHHRRPSAPGAVRERLDWRPRTRSRSPGSRRRGCSRPAAPAGSRSRTGRCAGPGMQRRETARRMVAFLVLLYTVYLAALVVFCGIFLRVGLFPGPSPVGMTIVPAAHRGCRTARAVAGLADSRRLRAPGRRAGHGDTGACGLARRLASGPGDGRGRHAHRALPAAPPFQRPALRSAARSGSGLRTSPSCGRASTPSARRSRRRCWCRASSSA